VTPKTIRAAAGVALYALLVGVVSAAMAPAFGNDPGEMFRNGVLVGAVAGLMLLVWRRAR